MTLGEIRARYVAIHDRAGWGNAGECFDNDVSDMDADMLRELGECYLALAAWKRIYVMGTAPGNTATPVGIRDTAA